jgi:hypothetical protein
VVFYVAMLLCCVPGITVCLVLVAWLGYSQVRHLMGQAELDGEECCMLAGTWVSLNYCES